MTTPSGDGDCYQAALNLIMRLGVPDAQLVHGYPTGTGGDALGLRYGHAWVELGSVVLDDSNGGSACVHRDTYYAVGSIKPEECQRYSEQEARDAILEHEHYGPWPQKTKNS